MSHIAGRGTVTWPTYIRKMYPHWNINQHVPDSQKGLTANHKYSPRVLFHFLKIFILFSVGRAREMQRWKKAKSLNLLVHSLKA